jgi:hypothetical protein
MPHSDMTKTGCAKAALRTMAVHHGLLNRVQVPRGHLSQILHSEKGAALQCVHELDAGIDSVQRQTITAWPQLPDHNGARTAVTLIATFFGACAVLMFS